MNLPSFLRSWISNQIASILIVAGYRGGAEEVSGEVVQKFGERINVIVGTALKLNQIFGAEVTSSDLGLMLVPQGSRFNPAAAEDIGQEAGSQKKADLVLCSTEVGLNRTVRVSKGGKMEATILLKPKVALQSVTDGLPMWGIKR